MPRVSGSTLAPLWVMAPVTFLMGWAFAFTHVGAFMLYAATGLTLVLFALQRSPAALAAMTGIMTIGWFIVFFTWPFAILVPAALLAIAWEWRLRRRRAERQARG